MHTIEALLREMVNRGGSDLHVSLGKYPYVRIGEGLAVLCKIKIDRAFFESMLQKVMKTENAFVKLFEKEEIDTTFEVPNVGRFRVNVGLARGQPFAVFRELKTRIPSPFELGIPKEFVDVVEEANYGLILLGGPTGSGKSTTMASCLNYVLKKYPEKVVTIEDPVEYLIGEDEEIKGYVVQREVGKDTKSFASALRAAMRQDPDYIVVGEVRDLETARYCIIAAETGHVVLTTIHVKDAVSAIGRWVGMFPVEEQGYAKRRLLDQLLAIQVQALVPGVDGKRCLATEVLILNDEVREMMEEDRLIEVRKMLKEGKCGWTMRRSLEKLYEKGKIEKEVLESYAPPE
jgi:twitching motility protein PilT